VYWSRRTDHIAYLVRLKRSLVLARAVSFVTLLASMTRMHGPMPSETQTHFRTVQFFTFSQLSSPAWSYKATATTPLCLFPYTSLVQLLCSCRGFFDLLISWLCSVDASNANCRRHLQTCFTYHFEHFDPSSIDTNHTTPHPTISCLIPETMEFRMSHGGPEDASV
jgi:hypothetical protein